MQLFGGGERYIYTYSEYQEPTGTLYGGIPVIIMFVGGTEGSSSD